VIRRIISPARLPKRLERRVKDFALRAYRLTGCRDYARIDMRLTKDGQPHVLEVNPNPDLTEGVSFMEDNAYWHGAVIDDESYRKARQELIAGLHALEEVR
jgi:D-alanine-D-alanine ligase-like ATP-grasp enzyme